MERAGDALQDLLHRLRLSEPLEAWRAVEIWPEAVGEKIASRARAVGCRGGVLTVEVESPVWMAELTYLRRKLAEELNRRLGSEVVREIRLRPSGGRDSRSPDRTGA